MVRRMEGTHRPAAEYARPAVRLRPTGLPAAMPAVVVLGAVYAVFFFVAMITSLAWYDSNYQLRFWPPEASAYVDSASRVTSLLVASILHVLPTLLLAAVFGGLAGYFLALKAPLAVRRWGLFLVVTAWALTVPRLIATLHLYWQAPASVWFPWMRFDTPADLPVLFASAMPPIALGVYSALRGEFLGLVWPGSPGTRSERLVTEALPRATVGIAFGILLAGTFEVLVGLASETFGGASVPSVARFIEAQVIFPGGVPQGSAALLIVLGGFMIVFLGFLGLTALLHSASRTAVAQTPRPVPRQRGLSIASFIVSGISFGFVIVTAFVPIAMAAIFSLNAANSLWFFEGWSARWYVDSPGTFGIGEGLFSLPAYWSSFLRSTALAAIVSGVAAPLGVAAAAGVFRMPQRTRSLVRAFVYVGLIVPVTVFAFVGVFASLVGSSPGYPVVQAEGFWRAAPAFFAQLPFAIGISFVVAGASGGWRQAAALRAGPYVWIRPIVAAALVSFAFLLATYNPASEFSQMTFVSALVESRRLTPLVDAALVVLTLTSVLALFGAWIAMRREEMFRF